MGFGLHRLARAGRSYVTAVGFAVAAIATTPAAALVAQGLTGASVIGTVGTSTGGVAAGSNVALTELNTGVSHSFITDNRGRFAFESVPVGLYRIEARAIGLHPASRDSISLHLGDRMEIRLTLSAPTQLLDPVMVNSRTLTNAGAGGPAYSILRGSIQNLPLLNRDFVGLFGMTPQAVGPGSLWISGQHARYNGIQIDGAIGNDLFGVNITPGSSAGARSVSLEALDEIRVLIAPFDVRQGGFSGGLINAVTRSGTNARHASVFSSYSRAEFVGVDTGGTRAPAFNQWQYGGSVGGPIIQNRLHFFAVADIQSRATPSTGQSVNDPATGVSAATVLRAEQIVRARYGFDPGGSDAPILQQPNSNLSLKVSWRASANHSVSFTASHTNAYTDGLSRTNSNTSDGWQLSKSGTASRAKTYGLRVNAISTLGAGAFSNEVIASVAAIDANISSHIRAPLFIVGADLPGSKLAIGSASNAQGTITTQRVVELTDNISLRKGSHFLTLGTQNVLFHVQDNFTAAAWGVWTFSSVDSLANNVPSRYDVTLKRAPGSPLADYSAALLAGYLQDEWKPLDKLRITAGLRTDVPFLEAPATNDALVASAKLGAINTARMPTGNAVVTPRVGISWDVGERHPSLLRAGIGAFAGRPPFAWITSAYSNTGQQQTALACTQGGTVPAPVGDIEMLPTHCANSTTPTPPIPSVTNVDSHFRFQRAIKYAIGIDHDFGHSLSASLDVIHTRGRDNVVVTNANLAERGLNSEGRMMYGDISSSGRLVVTSNRRDSAFGPVYRFSNVAGDRSTSVSLSVERKWGTGGLLQMGYNWSESWDVMSMSGLTGEVSFRSNPVDGTLAERNRRRSARDVPHNFVATAIIAVPARATAALFFRARAGTPYAFTVSNGDANADGSARNDLVYVPKSANDISLSNASLYPALDAFIERLPCTRQQRGRIMTRNSCRNPTVYALDGRLAKKLWTRNARGFEIAADLFNIPNMLNSHWGLMRETARTEDAPLLLLNGWDSAMNRPRYAIRTSITGQPILAEINKVVVDPSRWRVQLGARFNY